jgi:hypothetical protein
MNINSRETLSLFPTMLSEIEKNGAKKKPSSRLKQSPFFSPCLFEIIAILFFRLRRLIIQIARTFCRCRLALASYQSLPK